MIVQRTLVPANTNIDTLNFQIMDALAKVIELTSYNGATGVMDLTVEETWDAADDTSLDTIIANHNPATDIDFVIKDLTLPGNSKEVSAIDYKVELLSSIYPERTFSNGLLTQVVYYKDRNPTTKALSTKVLQVDVVYELGTNSIYPSAQEAISKTTTRRWYRNTGELDTDSTKITHKYYPHIIESRAEGGRRRSNIFNITSQDIVVLLMFTETAGDQHAAETLAIGMVTEYESEFANFIKVAAVDVLYTTITNDTIFTWLNNLVPANATVQFMVPNAIIGETLRSYILRAFSGEL